MRQLEPTTETVLITSPGPLAEGVLVESTRPSNHTTRALSKGRGGNTP